MTGITVALASRDRPWNLAAVLVAFYRLRSGQNEIDFLVGLDDDDTRSIEMMTDLQKELPLRLSVGPRPIGLGDVWARMAQEIPPGHILSGAGDKTFPVTPGWDAVVAHGCGAYPERVLWWDCSFYDGAAMFILPPRLRSVLGIEMSGLFPFWFDDNWIEEIDLLLHGFPRMRVEATYSGEHLPTKRFRDYPFWVEVFAATRSQRLERAGQLGRDLGVEWKDRPEVLAWLGKRDQLWRDAAPEMEARLRSPEDPSEDYIIAKSRAEALLDARKEIAA